MPPQTLVARVERLEDRVSALEQLPGQVAEFRAEFLQFRDEVRGEFSAVRLEMRKLCTELGTDLRAELRTDLRAELRTELHAEIGSVRTELREMRAQMLTLHEEVLARIALIGEGRGRRKKR